MAPVTRLQRVVPDFMPPLMACVAGGSSNLPFGFGGDGIVDHGVIAANSHAWYTASTLFSTWMRVLLRELGDSSNLIVARQS